MWTGADMSTGGRGAEPLVGVGRRSAGWCTWRSPAARCGSVQLDREVTELDVDDTPAHADQTLAAGTADQSTGGGIGDEETVETVVADVREAGVADPFEHADPDQPTRRVPTVDEVAAAVERARDALLEMHNRGQLDAAPDHHPDHDDANAPSLGRWADGTEQHGDADAAVFEAVDA